MAAEYLPGTPGERIRDLRKEAKLNQDEFAEAIGISRSTTILTLRSRPTIALRAFIGIIHITMNVIIIVITTSHRQILSILSFFSNCGSLKASVLKNAAIINKLMPRHIRPDDSRNTSNVSSVSSGAVTNTEYIVQKPHSIAELKKQNSFFANGRFMHNKYAVRNRTINGNRK